MASRTRKRPLFSPLAFLRQPSPVCLAPGSLENEKPCAQPHAGTTGRAAAYEDQAIPFHRILDGGNGFGSNWGHSVILARARHRGFCKFRLLGQTLKGPAERNKAHSDLYSGQHGRMLPEAGFPSHF